MEEIKEYFHAIKVNIDNCTGCTHCVAVCPTEAIRVRQGKVQIDADRCIDCGRCIQTCNYKALTPKADSLDIIKNYKYKIAILSSAFASQFKETIGYDQARQTILDLGFDEVADEAEVARLMLELVRKTIQDNPSVRPLISSSCPAVVRLIQVRFPSLLENVLPLEAPMSILSQYYRQRTMEEKGFKESEIGIFQIVPCIAHVVAVHQPEAAYKQIEEGAFSIGEIYNRVLSVVPDNGTRRPNNLIRGHTWAISGMKSDQVGDKELKTMAVSGVKNVIRILSAVENHQIEKFDYIVCWNCISGCVGGNLNVENPFVATSRIKRFLTDNKIGDLNEEHLMELFENGQFGILPLEPRSMHKLDTDIKQAINKMKQINEINNKLPGLNCSACGSPTCMALAEDIVLGKATIEDCVVLLRRKKSK